MSCDFGDCFFYTFSPTVRIWKPFLPCRVDKGSHKRRLGLLSYLSRRHMALNHFHLIPILAHKSCTLTFFLRTFALREEEERRKDRYI